MARLRALGVALVLVLSTVGCEDEPEPDIPDPTPSSTAPSPSETESSPTTSPTPEALSPEETVRAWVDAWNAGLASGDAEGLSKYEASDCRNCANLAAVIRDVADAGGSFTGGEWSIVNATTTKPAKNRARVSVAMAVAAGSTINSAGEDPVTFEAEKRIVVYQLVDSSGSWLIDVIELLS